MPAVSIIIPVYNTGKLLHETLVSVLEQTFKDFELILVNDGSTDTSEQVIFEFAENDDRIKYLTKKNSGMCDSRNVGLKKATGEYIVFFDHDDIMEPQFLDQRFHCLDSHPGIGICGSGIKVIDGNGKILDGQNMKAPGDGMLEEILLYIPGIASLPSNFMIRRKILADNQIDFDSRLNSSADKLFLVKLALVTKCRAIDEATLNYRVHTKSMYHNTANQAPIFFDNKLFVEILKNEQLIPPPIQDQVLKKNYYMLAGSAFNAKLYFYTLFYGIKYFMISFRVFLN